MSPSPNPTPQRIRKVGVVGVIVREERLLVIRRSHLVRAPGHYCFPGGAMELGEFEDQTLLREMQEELGVEVRPIRRLQRTVTPWGVELRWWMAQLDPAATLQPHPAEVETANWYSVADFLALEPILESNRHFLAAWERGEFEIDGLTRTLATGLVAPDNPSPLGQ